jgi:hypothetical protein
VHFLSALAQVTLYNSVPPPYRFENARRPAIVVDWSNLRRHRSARVSGTDLAHCAARSALVDPPKGQIAGLQESRTVI